MIKRNFYNTIIATILLTGSSIALQGEIFQSEYPVEYKYRYNGPSIKTINGKFYAYIVLLFNENPHFANLIQSGAIPIKDIGTQGFNIKAYRNYLSSIQDPKLQEEAEQILKIYLDPEQFSDNQLRAMEKNLEKRSIIIKFYREGYYKGARISLDYCIYGERVKINISHPLFDVKEDMYYVKPYIYYDEFSTSNSTFYHDMIYINPEEVNNDYIIAKNIISGKNIKSMFFVGSKVTDDIRDCIIMAFKNNNNDIYNEIWKMFVIHELTHKILNNNFNNFDQVTGEEISLSSTIYENVYLGLSVMYSYLNYGNFNPHRIAAMNYINFIADATGNKEIINNTSAIKNIGYDKLREITKNHFNYCISKLKGRK